MLILKGNKGKKSDYKLYFMYNYINILYLLIYLYTVLLAITNDFLE